MRLINVDRLIDLLCKMPPHYADLSNVFAEIGSMPIVEIVQCKDCRYQLKHNGMSGCKIFTGWTKTDDRFCSFGERKGE